jgi:hypothetical protein
MLPQVVLFSAKSTLTVIFGNRFPTHHLENADVHSLPSNLGYRPPWDGLGKMCALRWIIMTLRFLLYNQPHSTPFSFADQHWIRLGRDSQHMHLVQGRQNLSLAAQGLKRRCIFKANAQRCSGSLASGMLSADPALAFCLWHEQDRREQKRIDLERQRGLEAEEQEFMELEHQKAQELIKAL